MAYSGPVPYGQAKIALVHPLADEVSIVWGYGTYSSESERELAFFKNGEWVSADIPELAQHSDGSHMPVYPYVPIEELLAFLTAYMLSCERYPMMPAIG